MDLDVVSSDRLHQYYLPAGAIMPGQLQVPFTLLSIAHRRHHARQVAPDRPSGERAAEQDRGAGV